ncbi:GNAT family protein [soil metagenome]
MPTPHWPLWDIRVRTPRVELRPAHEPEIPALIDLISGGLHDPSDMPFLQPFTDMASPERERGTYQYVLSRWGNWSPDAWELPFAVVVDDVIVGCQSIEATKFPIRRSVTSGSWLGRAYQGQGIGTEMRAAVLEFVFRGLGALRAETSAYVETIASRRVTEKLGYSPDGWSFETVRDERRRNLRFALERQDWAGRDDVVIEGLGAEALDQFGLS